MATNVWEGNGGTKNWSSSVDWSLNHVPIATEDVVIDGTGSAICNLDQNTALLNSLTISAVGFNGNSWNINVAGSVVVTGGTNDFGTSTLVLTASGNISNATEASAFYNVTQVGAITTTATGDVYTDGVVTTSDTGTITDDGGGTRDFRINGSLVVGGVTWVSVGTLALWFGPGTTMPGDDYGNINLRIRFDSTNTVTMGGDVTTTNGVLIGALLDNHTNTLDTGGYAFSCELLQLGLSGQTARGGELSVTGVSTVEITGQLTVFTDDGTQVNGITVAASGTNAFSIGGHWTVNTGATMDMQDSVVTFDGSGAQSITSGGEAFANVIVNKSGGTVTLQDALVCDTFTHTGGSFNDSGVAITVAGLINVNTPGLFTGTGSLTQTGDANFTYANNGTYSINTQAIDLQGTGSVSLAGSNLRPAAFTCAASGKVTTIATIGGASGWSGTLTLGTGTFTLNTSMTWVGTGAENTPIVTGGATINGTGLFNLLSYHAALITVTIPNLTIVGTVEFQMAKVSGDGVCTFSLGTLSAQTIRAYNGRDLATAGVVLNTNGNALTAQIDFSVGSNTANGPFTLNAGASNISASSVGNSVYNGAGGTTLNMGTSAWTVTGNWTTQSNHTISPSLWGITFSGTGQAVDFAGEPVNNVTVTSTGTVSFTTAPNIQGTFKPGNGASAMAIRFPTTGTTHWEAVDTSAASGTGTIDLNSIGEAAPWALTIGSNQTVTSVDVTYSNLTGFDIDATDPTNVDGGNNSANWLFAAVGALPMAMDTYRRRRT